MYLFAYVFIAMGNPNKIQMWIVKVFGIVPFSMGLSSGCRGESTEHLSAGE